MYFGPDCPGFDFTQPARGVSLRIQSALSINSLITWWMPSGRHWRNGQADLLLHVMDASHPQAEQQQAVVYRVLHELGVGDKPLIEIGQQNRLVEDNLPFPVCWRRKQRNCRLSQGRAGVDRLLQAIMAAWRAGQHTSFIIPYSPGASGLWYTEGRVIKKNTCQPGYTWKRKSWIWAGASEELGTSRKANSASTIKQSGGDLFMQFKESASLILQSLKRAIFVL